MGNIKLDDILRVKKPGDEWYAIEAPEQLHFWVTPWDKKLFSDNKLAIAGVKMEASAKAGGSNVIRYSNKKPLRLKCGVEITSGQFGTTTTTKGIFKYRTDGIIELNEAMKELTVMSGLKTWTVKQLEVYNPKEGATMNFEIYDPDANGGSLYLYRVHRNGRSRLYHEILVSEQNELLKNFKNNIAHCTAVKIEARIAHACAIKRKLKKDQVKTRKKTNGQTTKR